MLESGERPSSPAKGSHVVSLNPLGKIKDVALGAVLHPRKTAGTVVGTARGTVGLGRDLAGQVGGRLPRRPTSPSAPPVRTSEPTAGTTSAPASAPAAPVAKKAPAAPVAKKAPAAKKDPAAPVAKKAPAAPAAKKTPPPAK